MKSINKFAPSSEKADPKHKDKRFISDDSFALLTVLDELTRVLEGLRRALA